MSQYEDQHKAERRIAILVHIAEPLLQAGVYAALADESDLEVIGAPSAHIDSRIDVVVTDSATAALITEDLRRSELGSGLQRARILVIAAQAREHAVRSALKQGVHGFVLTRSPVHELLTAVRTLACGRPYLCATLAQQLAQVTERDILTNREDEVLRLLAKGRCNKSIARDLDIAVGTVKVHVKSIMSKLDASSRTEAASIATERGLVDVLASSLRHVKPYSNTTTWFGSLSPQPRYA
ncbi:MAG: response regulator transcription factor [Pseudomonadota bacterium]